jgi:hypothetical protein
MAEEVPKLGTLEKPSTPNTIISGDFIDLTLPIERLIEPKLDGIRLIDAILKIAPYNVEHLTQRQQELKKALHEMQIKP